MPACSPRSAAPGCCSTRAIRPRVAVPVHEGETTDPAKYTGMLAAFAPDGVVRPLPRAQAVTP
jgi:hypothetical protein